MSTAILSEVVSVKEPDAIYYKDATELASLIRTKQLSSREVVQAHLDRIEAINPKVNAIVTLLAEDALKAADAAQRAIMSGTELGPLHGVPFTIKDAIDTAGVLTQRGSRIFAGNIPKKDATAVTRFKRAGAIPLAKTNLPEFWAWQETDRPVQEPVESRPHSGGLQRWRVSRNCRRPIADRHRQRPCDLGTRSSCIDWYRGA